MMKRLSALLLVFPTIGIASPQYYIALDSGRGSALWLDQRKIDNKDVYVLGYKNSENQSFETALPTSEHQRLSAEMKSFIESKNQSTAVLPGPTCKEAVYFEALGKIKFACYDLAKRKDKAKLTSWFKKISRLALGMSE